MGVFPATDTGRFTAIVTAAEAMPTIPTTAHVIDTHIGNSSQNRIFFTF
jgi:hypothetical protein